MMMLGVGLGLKISATFPLIMKEKMFMVMGELYIGPRPATITPKEEILWVMVQDM